MILDKIRKILARADIDRNDNEHEREIALRQANALLAKHGLSMADVNESSDELGKVGRSSVSAGRNVWIAGVYDKVAELNHCRVIRSTTSHGRQEIWIIGRNLHVNVVKLMAEYLIKSIRREAKINRYNIVQFGSGAWSGISQQVKRILAENAKGNIGGEIVEPGKAMILVNQHKQYISEANSAITKFFGGFTECKNYRSRASSDYDAGKAYGSSVNLNKSINSNKQRLN